MSPDKPGHTRRMGTKGRTAMSDHTYRVTEIRGHIVDGDVGHYQVGMKLGFRLEDG
ncbi:MAG: hypothetical protein GEU86_03530 [Actinophytocola sp.]|nr:hypothetical protein [Actinophytocola sp.]